MWQNGGTPRAWATSTAANESHHSRRKDEILRRVRPAGVMRWGLNKRLSDGPLATSPRRTCTSGKQQRSFTDLPWHRRCMAGHRHRPSGPRRQGLHMKRLRPVAGRACLALCHLARQPAATQYDFAQTACTGRPVPRGLSFPPSSTNRVQSGSFLAGRAARAGPWPRGGGPGARTRPAQGGLGDVRRRRELDPVGRPRLRPGRPAGCLPAVVRSGRMGRTQVKATPLSAGEAKDPPSFGSVDAGQETFAAVFLATRYAQSYPVGLKGSICIRKSK